MTTDPQATTSGATSVDAAATAGGAAGVPAPAEQLRGAGLRVTAGRVAVLEAVAGVPHATADDVVRTVREALGSVSVQAVYDALHALTEARLLRRIEPAGHPARYERRVGDNHHHVVCRSCGVVADVDCTVGHAPCLTPSSDHGFVIDLAEVTYWGLCPQCAAARAS
ncbi:Fur family transcriptional regulator [Puerhibacterium puerhi]|uniref:Fur family transcriptional regulator n=1 Tax=Puerhibacterium puerhi TaxID=2692623 RepID=UPI00135C8028|nr:Fur family transcriptional regulator [Puerhibacterium puerhi]